ncbi:Protein of unknown function [Gryllus bimaculatus]|nr:Protein of unknown function [Gryllus bimaculatus]
MLPDISIKESEIVHPEIKDSIKRETFKQTQLPSRAASCFNLQDNNSHKQKFKFHYIKSTEETKTGFPILPAALNPFINNSSSVTESTKSCRIPLRNLPENSDSILIPGIKNFLWKCYNYGDKRRRSSRVCKHKPGVKHYCRRKNWDTILSKYKTEVLDNPLIDLGSFYKTNFLSSNKELLTEKQNDTQNKTEEPLVLTSHKVHSPQEINFNNIGTCSTSKYSECDTTSQDVASTSSDANSNNVGLQNGNEADDMSLFLALFGLKRKVSQKEVVNCSDLKLVNAETSNNAEVENTANIEEISGGIGPDVHSVGVVEESTNNNMGPVISSESSDLKEVRDKDFQEFTEVHDCANTEITKHCQKEKGENNISSENNSEYLDINTTQPELSDNQVHGDGAHENFVSSSLQECSCHSERIACQVNPVNETCISLHSSVGVNNFLVDNLLRNGSLNVTSCPPAHSSFNVNCESRGHIANNHEQEINNSSNHLISSFPGPFPRNPGSQPCTPRQMYSQTGGVNGVFPNFYGSPCLPTPILASQLVSPIFAYNFLPMNNVMCASHPGLMPFPHNSGYVSTSFDCTSQQSVHHSLPLSFHSAQSNPSNIYHKPGFHQWVNVNTSARVPCWTQSTYIGGTHLPCCGGSSHALEARSQLHFSSGYYPSDSYNSFLTHPFNSDVRVGNDVVNVTCSKTDDVK